MFKSYNINVFDIKFLLSVIAGIYIYVRKGLPVFLYISLGLIVFELSTKYYNITGGYATLLLAVILVLIFAVSFKEIFDYDKKGISANQLLKPDKFDFVLNS